MCSRLYGSHLLYNHSCKTGSVFWLPQVKCLNWPFWAPSISAVFSTQNTTCYIELSECGNKMLITQRLEGTFHKRVPDVVFTVAAVSGGKNSSESK